MEKLFVLFVLAVALNVSLGMSFRHKRQLNPDDDENSLDDRYGWDRRPHQAWGNQQPWVNRPNQGGNNGQQNQWGNQGGQQPRPTPASTPNGNGSTTQSSSVAACLRSCPVTPEYNPVCGTNMVQYPNPGRLLCAQSCGINVSLLRSSPCPTTTTAPPS